MSERWTPNDPDSEPFANLTLPNGESLEARRHNAHLFTHLGQLALFDFIKIEKEDGSLILFSFISAYQQLSEYMIEHDYPMHLNQPEVHESIVEAYYNSCGESEDFVPDEWL